MYERITKTQIPPNKFGFNTFPIDSGKSDFEKKVPLKCLQDTVCKIESAFMGKQSRTKGSTGFLTNAMVDQLFEPILHFPLFVKLSCGKLSAVGGKASQNT